MTNEEIYKKNQKVDFRGEDPIIGRAHTGKFSQNNPYLENLQNAWNLRDESAIYEMAVKWEAEYSDTLEAREFSDPINEVARQRRAGINPDIASSGGASGGVGSSSGTLAIDTPTQNTASFGSPQDTTSTVIQGLATAGQVVSALSSFGATAIGGMATLAMLPIQQRAGQLANQLASDLMPHQVSNAENIATAGQIANRSAQLGLLNQMLGIYNSFSSFITPDMTDEQSAPILQSLGVPADQIPSYQQGIKQWHSNPQYKAFWEKSKAEQREAEVYNEVFTREYQRGLLDMVAQLKSVESSLDFVHKDFELKVAKFLNTDEYAESVGQNTIASTNLSTNQIALSNKQIGLQSEQVDFARKQLERDMEAYGKQLDYLVTATNLSRSTIDRIKSNANNEGRSLSAAEEAMIQVEEQKILHYTTLGSNSLSRAKDSVLHTIQNHYFHRALIDNSTGLQLPTWFNPNYEKFMSGRLNFNSLVDGSVTSSEVTSSFANTLLDFGLGLSKP